MKSTKLYEEVLDILDKRGWRNAYEEDDEDFIYFDVDDVSYAVVKKDNGKELDSLSIMTAPENFPDDFIPEIFIRAAIVNNRHTCARVAIHSHIYYEGLEDNLFGCEFSIPKSCITDVTTAIEEGIAQLTAIYHDFLNEMGVGDEEAMDGDNIR